MNNLTIIGNWKMNLLAKQANSLASDVVSICGRSDLHKLINIVICPPFISIDCVAQAVAGSRVQVGAQNVHDEVSGAFTGEVSASMVAELANFAIVGHSERRILFGESDEFVNRKVIATLDNGLKPILCIGESFEQRQAGRAEDVMKSQLLDCLENVSDISDLLVAYEPIWAIGSGEAASPQIAQGMMNSIRSVLRSEFGNIADSIPCLYGGSVNADNIQDFVREPDIDGALVGGASLSAESFAAIVARASEVASG